MRATIKTKDGRTFTGELVEDAQFWTVDSLIVKAEKYKNCNFYPIRIGVLNGVQDGRSEDDTLPGDRLTTGKARKLIAALQEAVAWAEGKL